MKASEAKKISQNSSKTNEEIDEVISEVEQSAKEGKTYTFYYKGLTKEQQRELKKLGYKVEDQTDHEGIMYLIEW